MQKRYRFPRFAFPSLYCGLAFFVFLLFLSKGAFTQVETVAGTGLPGFSGDGGPARQAQLKGPTGILFGPEGSLYIADSGNHRIRRIRPDGIIETVAGTGVAGFSGDGGLAIFAQLSFPLALAFGPDGSLLFTDIEDHRVRKITLDGFIFPVAGNGEADFKGDGGPAEQASLNFPAGLAFDSLGNLYISDFGNSRLRKVSPEGVIQSVPFESPLLEQPLSLLAPYGLVFHPEGSLIIADFAQHSLFRLSPTGVLNRIAGTGTPGDLGDNGPAEQALLKEPAGLALSADGTLFFSDSGNNKVRALRPDGIAIAVAGTGEEGFNGDGKDPLLTTLSDPIGLAVGPDGWLYIADEGNHRIRRMPLKGVALWLYGDLNGDGVVNLSDAVLALRAVVGLVPLSPGQKNVADVAPRRGAPRLVGDGKLDLRDVVRIIRRAVGLEKVWP